MDKVAVGKRLREERKSRGLAPGVMARRMKIAENTLRSHENGSRAPDIFQLAAYARHYRVTTDYLLTGVKAGEPNPHAAEVIDLFDEMEERERKRALDILRRLARDESGR